MSKHLQYHPSHLDRSNPSLKWFLSLIGPGMRVLEMGTKRWFSHATHHKDYFPAPSEYIMTDLDRGIDVDVACDAHKLSDTFGIKRFDAVFCASVFEHLHSPWIAADEILKVLKPGGIFFIQTHHTFPIHGFPNDYFRFSKEALIHLFSKATYTNASYDYPCKILPENKEIDWNHAAQSYLNVNISGMK